MIKIQCSIVLCYSMYNQICFTLEMASSFIVKGNSTILFFSLLTPKSKIRGILFLSCFSFCNSFWNFNLSNNFFTVRHRTSIFQMSIPCDPFFKIGHYQEHLCFTNTSCYVSRMNIHLILKQKPISWKMKKKWTSNLNFFTVVSLYSANLTPFSTAKSAYYILHVLKSAPPPLNLLLTPYYITPMINVRKMAIKLPLTHVVFNFNKLETLYQRMLCLA